MATMRLENLPDTGRVSVACKLPNGLRLDLPTDEKDEADRDAAYKATRGSGQPFHYPPIGEVPFATLRGFAVPYGQPALHVSGGYGITTGIDAQKFKRWYERMKAAKFPPVVNGLVFACAAEGVARDKATEQAELKSGLEPIDPNNPGRGVEVLKEDA
jgi:hypothetical protein